MDEKVSGSSVEGRSAEKYAEAVNAVIALAGMAVPFLPTGGKVAAAAGVVMKAAPFAQAAAEQLPKIAPVLAPAAKKVADAAAEKLPAAVDEGVGKVAGAVKGAAGAVGGAMGGADAGTRDKVKEAIDFRAQEKARMLARKTLLDGAGIRMSAEKFTENWETQQKLVDAQAGEGYLAYSGCYVVITCDGAVHKDDYSKYRELYVGKSENMGASIHADFIGLGNADVYADVKYKQHVYVLLYPCEKDKLDELEASLITALDADESYNRER